VAKLDGKYVESAENVMISSLICCVRAEERFLWNCEQDQNSSVRIA